MIRKELFLYIYTGCQPWTISTFVHKSNDN